MRSNMLLKHRTDPKRRAYTGLAIGHRLGMRSQSQSIPK